MEISKSDIIELAIEFMERAHIGQTRWDGSPYANHPLDVYNKLMEMNVLDNDVLIAGLLHDVVEDTDYTIGDINKLFGVKVANLVTELTFDQTEKSYPKYLARCEEMSRDASFIKIADIISNLSDSGKKGDSFMNKRLHALLVLVRNIQ